MCSELVHDVVPNCHNNVLSVTDDFNTIPPPDTYESLPKGVPVIVANSIVLSSTLKSSTMADVPVPSMFRLPCILTLPTTSSVAEGVVLKIPTRDVLESMNMADTSAGFFTFNEMSEPLTLFKIIAALGKPTLPYFKVKLSFNPMVNPELF